MKMKMNAASVCLAVLLLSLGATDADAQVPRRARQAWAAFAKRAGTVTRTVRDRSVNRLPRSWQKGLLVRKLGKFTKSPRPKGTFGGTYWFGHGQALFGGGTALATLAAGSAMMIPAILTAGAGLALTVKSAGPAASGARTLRPRQPTNATWSPAPTPTMLCEAGSPVAKGTC